MCADTAASFCPSRSNKPNARSMNDNHQKKYPIPRPEVQLSVPRSQCAFKKKAAAATHAEACRTERVPRNTTHGDPTMNKSVVIALKIASTTPYHELPPSQAALHAMRKACHPLRGSILPPPILVTTGRNHADP